MFHFNFDSCDCLLIEKHLTLCCNEKQSKRFGTELCVSVANISRSQNELLHVNTTPELPIKYAIRASMSLPFVFDPVRLGKNLGLHPGDVYIDGGILNNFPIK